MNFPLSENISLETIGISQWFEAYGIIIEININTERTTDMGWTGVYDYPTKPNGKPDARQFLDKELTWESQKEIYTVLKSAMVGNVYYAAVQAESKEGLPAEVFGVVSLTSYNNKDSSFNYKIMSEREGPNESKCPVSIIKLLTPTDSQWANEWRDRCFAYAAEKRAEHKSEYALNKLPYGSYIEFELKIDLNEDFKEGDTIRLYKCQRNGKDIWSDGKYRFPRTILPKEYDVVSIGNRKLEVPIHVSFNGKQQNLEK